MLLAVALVTYVRWLVLAARRGTRWPWYRTGAFLVALALFAVLQFGIVGTYDRELRWAFTLRLALLLLAVPAFAALGAPIALLRLGAGPRTVHVAERILHSRFVSTLGNAIVSPLVSLAVFLLLITPFAATMRTSSGWEVAVTVLVPLLGFAMIAPLTEPEVLRTSTFVTAEFLLAFVELIIDAIPGIVLRITGTVLDHATTMAAGPSWFPTPLRDQQLAGDLLWFIAEVADIPVLIALFIRWQRTDRHEARTADELTDEEMAELTRAHLEGFRDR